MAETKMSVFICDGCGKRVIAEDGPPKGFHGVAFTTGQEPAGWYACKPTCIRLAVETVLEGVGDVAGASSEA